MKTFLLVQISDDEWVNLDNVVKIELGVHPASNNPAYMFWAHEDYVIMADPKYTRKINVTLDLRSQL